ncbi:ArsR/SmtB family transcription factor [Peribacillus sp. SCS-155]|uniref:ArsR/SmtB family transcription factor n=1 Tax=Peribacillus sedimenti TaxID=3115297 RepID=UPI003905A8B4
MEEQDICEVTCEDNEKVTRVQGKTADQNFGDVSTIFKALSDETRLKVIYALSVEEELCVCDVANIIGATVATTSHHLRYLKKIGLANFRKEGKLVYYSIENQQVKQMVQLAFDHHKEVMNLD